MNLKSGSAKVILRTLELNYALSFLAINIAMRYGFAVFAEKENFIKTALR